MASVTLNIVVTDTVNHPLAQVRDKLLVRWNYLGGGGIGWAPTGTSQNKLDFIEARLSKFAKLEYIEQFNQDSIAALVQPLESDVDIQQG